MRLVSSREAVSLKVFNDVDLISARADGSPRTSFFDASGTARLVLETSEDGESFVTLCDSIAQPRVALQAAADAEGLYLNEGRELVRVSLHGSG